MAVRLAITAFMMLCFTFRNAAAQQTRGSVSGAVLSDDGRTVASANVRLNRVPRYIRDRAWRVVLAQGEVKHEAVTRTDSAGRFSVADLPAGTYRLCADAPGTGFLNSCQWNPEVLVRVTAGQASSAPVIRLQRGVQVRVEVEDLAQLLRIDRSTRNATLGLRGVNGAFYPFEVARDTWEPVYITPVDARGRPLGERVPAPGQTPPSRNRVFEILVPQGSEFDLWVHAPTLDILEGATRLNTSGPNRRIRANAPVSLVLKVAGLAPR
jgi:hypothetical protein